MAIGKEIKVVLSLDKDGFSVGIRDANGQLKTIAKQMEQTSGSVKRMEGHMHSFGQKMQRTVMTLGMARFALMDLHDIFLAFPKSVLKTGGEVERLTKLMEGLSSETDSVKKKAEALSNTKFLFNMAQNAPFEVKAIGDAFVKMKTGGLDPTNGSLRALIDGVARFGGTSDHLHRASIAIQQMGGKGKVSMEELRQQIGEAIPTAMEAMAQGFGMSVAELDKAVSKGTVSAEQGLKKMLVVMGIQNAGAAAEMMTTWTGMLEQLKTKWELFKLDIGSAGMFDTSKAALQELLDAFNGEQSGNLARAIGKTMNDVALSIINATKTIIEFREEIGSAAKLFVYYWVAAKGAAAFQSIKSQFDALRQSATLAAAQTAAVAEDQNRAYASAYAQQATHIKKKIALNNQEITAETTKAEALRAQQLQQVRDQIAANTAIMGAMRARLTEQRATEAALQASHAAAVSGIAGLTTPAHYAEAQALREKAAAAKIAADQSAQHIARMEAETATLQRQSLALRTANIEMNARQRHLHSLNTALAQSVAANQAMASSIAASNTQLGLMQRAIGGVGSFIKSMVTGVNGLMLAIFAAAAAWDHFTAKAKQAKQAAADAERLADMTRRGVQTQENIENARKIRDERQFKINANNDAIARYEASPAYNDEQAGKQMRKSVAILRERNQKLLTEIRQADDEIRTSQKDLNARTATAQSFELQNQADATATRAIADLTAKRTKFVADFKKKLNPNKEQQEAFDKDLEKLDLEILAKRRESLEFTAKNYRNLAAKAKDVDVDREKYLLAAAGVEKSSADLIEQATRRAEKFKPMASDKDKDKGGLTPEDDLLKAIRNDKRKILDGKQELAKLNGEIVDTQALRKQAKQQVAQIIELDRHRKVLHKPEDVAVAEQLRFETLMIEEAIKLQNTVVPKLAASQEKLDQLRDKIVKGDYRETPADEESKVLRELKKIAAASPEAALALKEVIATHERYLNVSRDIDTNNGIVANERTLQGLRLSVVRDARAKIALEGQREIEDVNHKYAHLISKTQKFSAERKRLEAQQAEEIRLINEKLAIELETPLEKITRDWQNVYRQLENYQANWADGFVNMLTDNLGKGRIEIGNFVQGVLRNIVNAKLKEQLASPLKEAIGGFTGFVQKRAFGPGVQSNPEAELAAKNQNLLASAASTAASGLTDVATKGTVEAVKGAVMSGVADTKAATTAELMSTSFVRATTSVELFAAALQQATATAGGNTGGGLIGGLLGGMGGGFNVASQAGSYGMTGAELLASFADGGIMTSMGPMQLRKYANGGVANSPQLALFGEGSMNEAYVPLPDGRSIPVTMKGGAQQPSAAPSVTVNVINQSGQSVNAQQGQMRFDGKGYILDVVMTAVNTPGSFRDGMKNAMKG